MYIWQILWTIETLWVVLLFGSRRLHLPVDFWILTRDFLLVQFNFNHFLLFLYTQQHKCLILPACPDKEGLKMDASHQNTTGRFKALCWINEGFLFLLHLSMCNHDQWGHVVKQTFFFYSPSRFPFVDSPEGTKWSWQNASSQKSDLEGWKQSCCLNPHSKKRFIGIIDGDAAGYFPVRACFHWSPQPSSGVQETFQPVFCFCFLLLLLLFFTTRVRLIQTNLEKRKHSIWNCKAGALTNVYRQGASSC